MFKCSKTILTQAAPAPALILALILALGPINSARAGAISVTIEAGSGGERVSYTAPGARLDQVLRAFADKAGFSLAISGDLSRPAHTATMRNVPLARAIRRLVGKTAMVMVFDRQKVAEVQLYPRP